ncbi:hypothetical protein CCUS01_08201 [Colletotrichum cuscutae]|uniref:Uncharacterized protein n=1 Tax=Colletotrichum cuscutae TaxID=1209917 RepID=A0AAI9US98_9PEZI|nr:hypothetical protein CCUS01_08201 [Colletotrichum cuscutae]
MCQLKLWGKSEEGEGQLARTLGLLCQQAVFFFYGTWPHWVACWDVTIFHRIARGRKREAALGCQIRGRARVGARFLLLLLILLGCAVAEAIEYPYDHGHAYDMGWLEVLERDEEAKKGSPGLAAGTVLSPEGRWVRGNSGTGTAQQSTGHHQMAVEVLRKACRSSPYESSIPVRFKAPEGTSRGSKRGRIAATGRLAFVTAAFLSFLLRAMQRDLTVNHKPRNRQTAGCNMGTYDGNNREWFGSESQENMPSFCLRCLLWSPQYTIIRVQINWHAGIRYKVKVGEQCGDGVFAGLGTYSQAFSKAIILLPGSDRSKSPRPSAILSMLDHGSMDLEDGLPLIDFLIWAYFAGKREAEVVGTHREETPSWWMMWNP